MKNIKRYCEFTKPARFFYALSIVIVLATLWGRQSAFAQTAQTQVFQEWTTTAGTQNFFQKSVTKTDASNNVFIAGATLNSNGNYDLLVAKYSPDGYQYWCNLYAGSGGGNDFATALTIDGSGNVIVTGSVLNSASDSNNVITIKYNSSGTQQWVATYHGGYGNDAGADVIADGSGNIYVCGVANKGSTNLFDAILIKYNSSGTQQWVVNYNYNNLYDGAYRVVLLNGGKIGIAALAQYSSTSYKLATVKYDSNGNFVSATVTGSNSIGFTMINSCMVDNQHNMYLTGSTNGTSSVDYYTIKLDSALNQLWTATYNGSSNLNDEAKGIVVDGSGNVYITGYSTTSTQGKDYVTIKYNSSGTQQWVQAFNGSAGKDDEATGIAIDASGNPVVCGSSDNGDSYDYYTIKYDPSGNIKWQMSWNSAANRVDRATDIAVDQSGAVIVTGQSKTGSSSYSYVTVKYAEHSVLMPTDSEPLMQSFCFTENRGQLIGTDTKAIPEIKFYNKENAGQEQLYFTDTRLSYVFARIDTSSTSPTDTLERVDMTLDNHNSDMTVYPMNLRTDYMNYFLGHIPDGCARVKNYDKLFVSNAYSNIDMVYSNNNWGVKYYYVVKPGGDPRNITEVYSGAGSVYVDGSGDLIVQGTLGGLHHLKPHAWQIDNSGNVVSLNWSPAYSVTDSLVSYTFGAYNSAYTLIIRVEDGLGTAIQQNPNDNLEWATHLGSQAGGDDPVFAVKTNKDGSSVFSGHSYGNNFPISTNIQPVSGGNADGTIVKFDAGAGFDWATYIGGPSNDLMYRIDLDTTGNIYFGGRTSGGLNTVQLAGAYYDNTYNNGQDWHIGKINASGSALLWSTYFGGNGTDYLEDIKVTPTADRLYIVGGSNSSNFPLQQKSGAYNTGTGYATIVEFDASMDTVWSARFGTGSTIIHAIDGDVNDGFFIAGKYTQSTSTIPFKHSGVSGCYLDTVPIGSDMFVARLSSGDTVKWCTGFGGAFVDEGWDILKTGKDVYVVGSTNSGPSSFPILADTTINEYRDDDCNQNNPDGFIARFGVAGNQKWTSYFGGVNSDGIYCVTADKSRTVYVMGTTLSYDFDMQPWGNSYQQFPNLSYGETFFAAFTPANHLRWATGFGGTNYEGTGGIATYGNEELYFCGNSNSIASTFPWDFPTGGYIDTAKLSTTPTTGFVGRFGIQNINVGIDEHVNTTGSFNFSLFPNPTSNSATVSVSGLYGDEVVIEVTDLLGQVVLNRKIESVFGTLYESLDTYSWSGGLYIVTVRTSSHGTVSKKLLKQ